MYAILIYNKVNTTSYLVGSIAPIQNLPDAILKCVETIKQNHEKNPNITYSYKIVEMSETNFYDTLKAEKVLLEINANLAEYILNNHIKVLLF